MSKKQIVNVVLTLGLLTFPLTGSASAENVLPTKVKESIETNENFEKKDDSATDEQKAKVKPESEEEEAIKKARMEWKKEAREKQETTMKTKKGEQEAEKKEKEAIKKARKKETKKNSPDDYFSIRQRGKGFK
jgi:hypothetical protein